MHLAECKALLLVSWAVSTLVSAPSGRSFSLSLCTHPSEAAAGCLGVSVTSHRGPRHLFFPLKGHWHSCVQPSLSGLLYTLSVWLPAHPAHRVSPVRFILEDLKKKCSYFHRMYDFFKSLSSFSVSNMRCVGTKYLPDRECLVWNICI